MDISSRLILISLILSFSFATVSQPLRNIEFYMQNEHVSQAAKDYYKGTLKATDDSSTFSILDSLKTKCNETRPFYILLVSKMISEADGSLSEIVGIHCMKLIENKPDYLLDYFSTKGLAYKQKQIKRWAMQISMEIDTDCEEKFEKCVNRSYLIAKERCRRTNIKELEIFYRYVKESHSL